VQGFVYLVSVTGVTGVKESNESRVEGLVAMLHGVTDKPVSSRPAPNGLSMHACHGYAVNDVAVLNKKCC